MQRILITLGVVLVILGLSWPWLQKLGLFRLPGDIVIERDGYNFYFPITSMIILSVVLSVIAWLIRRFM